MRNIDIIYNKIISGDDKIAIIWNDNPFSYKYLHSRIKYWFEKLKSEQMKNVYGIESDYSPETIAIFIALTLLNKIVVPLNRATREFNLEKIDIANVEYLLQIDTNEEVKTKEILAESPNVPYYKQLLSDNVSGLVLFTSGSSGKPKAAVHNLDKLLKKFVSLEKKALISINFLSFDHWGGLNTLFHLLSNLSTIVFLKNRTPDYVSQAIEKYKVELLPVSPSFLNLLLLSKAFQKYDLSSLKLITYGSEPMPETLLNNLNKVFPQIKFKQTYGLIELGVLKSKSESNDSLLVKLGGDGYEMRVVEGLLEIKAETAMLGYLNAASPFTSDGFFQTGDAVEVHRDYYKILGRQSELINVGGEKVFPQEIENVIYEIEGVYDVLVYAEKNSIVGSIVCAKVVFIDSSNKKEIIQKIKTHCNEKLERYKVPVKIELVDTIFSNERFKKQRV